MMMACHCDRQSSSPAVASIVHSMIRVRLRMIGELAKVEQCAINRKTPSLRLRLRFTRDPAVNCPLRGRSAFVACLLRFRRADVSRPISCLLPQGGD